MASEHPIRQVKMQRIGQHWGRLCGTDFQDKAFSRIFGSGRELRREYGDAKARSISLCPNALGSVGTLTELFALPPFRRRTLFGDRAGQYAVDLIQPYRLILAPAHDPLPEREDGGIDTDRITAVEIVAAVDCH